MFEINTETNYPTFIELDKVDAIEKTLCSPEPIMDGEKCIGLIDGYRFCVGPILVFVRAYDVQTKKSPSFEQFVDLVQRAKTAGSFQRAMLESEAKLRMERERKQYLDEQEAKDHQLSLENALGDNVRNQDPSYNPDGY